MPYELEGRTLTFAKDIRVFVAALPRSMSNGEDIKQLVRASGSVGANYIEANESLGKRDCVMRMRIAKKEAKEARFWLRLIDVGADKALEDRRNKLVTEASELMAILSAIIAKVA